jgi:phospholipase/carboxylesterase
MRHSSTSEEEHFVGLKFLYRAGARRDSPLVVLVHGRAGTREVIWTFERSIPEAAAVVSFQAFLPDALGGFSWWDMESTEDRSVAIGRAADKVSFAIERITELFDLAPRRLYGIGFSQGSVLLSAAVLTGALRLDGLGVLAGFVPKPEGKVRLLGLPEVFLAHGIQDEVVRVERARSAAEYLRSLGLSVTYIEDDVGHKVGIQGTRALKEWLAQRIA